MNDRLLIVIVLISLLVSLGATIFSINSEIKEPLVGYASNNQSGQIILNISSTLSVSLSDNSIDFGTCEINLSRGYMLLDSNLSSNGSNNADCTNNVLPDYFVVENNGNVEANISVQSDRTGSELFNDTDSWLAYKVVYNESDNCNGLGQTTYTNFSVANSSFPLCDNISVISGNNSFYVSMQAYVNGSVKSGGSAGITFTASLV